MKKRKKWNSPILSDEEIEYISKGLNKEERSVTDKIMRREDMKPIIEAFGEDRPLTDEQVDTLFGAYSQEGAMRLQCKNCGKVWTPNPRKWRDNPKERRAVSKYKGQDVKVLFCPACGVKVHLPIGTALYIWQWWGRLRKAWKEYKEEQRVARIEAQLKPM